MKYLFAASTGGHLAQLVRISARLDADPDSLWITFKSPQSEALLRGYRVAYVPYIAPRDLKGVIRAFGSTLKLLRRENFHEALSTGAGLALGVLPAARLVGINSTFVESVSRIAGPSLTGRILYALRFSRMMTPHATWRKGRWLPTKSVFASADLPALGSLDSYRNSAVFVTLGTIQPYRFDALIDQVLQDFEPNEKSVWQVGATTRPNLPGRTVDAMSFNEFQNAARNAELVITHAGVGTIMDLLDLGITPVVVPRRKFRQEHVDDHQLQIANLLVTDVPQVAVRQVGESWTES